MIGILAAAAFGELLIIGGLASICLLLAIGYRNRCDDTETARTERDAARVDAEVARQEMAALSQQLILAEADAILQQAGGENR